VSIGGAGKAVALIGGANVRVLKTLLASSSRGGFPLEALSMQ
jgi:hypothetical protein